MTLEELGDLIENLIKEQGIEEDGYITICTLSNKEPRIIFIEKNTDIINEKNDRNNMETYI